MYELLSCAYFVNPLFVTQFQKSYQIWQWHLFVVTMCVCLRLSVLINGMSEMLNLALIIAVLFVEI